MNRSPARAALYLANALIVLAAPRLRAQDLDVTLRAEFPVETAPVPSVDAFRDVVDPSYVPTLPAGEAAASLLEEARWTFSGMVWGYDFVYTPSDRARAIAELFTATPRGELPWGGPGLSVVSTRVEGSLLYATVAWTPWKAARAELAAWSSAAYASAQGRGTAPAIVGAEPGLSADGRVIPAQVMARRAAVEDAMREAVRALMRTLERSKPREVRGSFALAGPPRIVMAGGEFAATVRLRVLVTEVLSYGGY